MKQIRLSGYIEAIAYMVNEQEFEPDFSLKVVNSFLDRMEAKSREMDHCHCFDEDEPCDDGSDDWCPICGAEHHE